MAENAVDSPHFKFLHNHLIIPTAEIKEVGRELFVKQYCKVKRMGITFLTSIDINLKEPGFGVLRFSHLGSKMLMITSTVAVDDNYIDQNFTFIMKKNLFPPWTWLLKKLVVGDIIRTFLEDRPIWENKKYLTKPILCDGDGPIIKIRRWHSQFYN